jgi:phage repressor protein C with HTH and peptisase S24 domain
MDPILAIIDEAVERLKLSDASASKMAVGNPALIKNMKSDRSDEKRYSFQALQRLADVLDLECYFGPKRETAPVPQITLDGTDYASIPLHEAWLSAGPGIDNGGSNIIDHLAFRRDWLARIGISASQSCLARVWGDSMFPTLSPGDMVLIDTSKTSPPERQRASTDRRRSAIWAFVENGEARIKRVERPSDTSLILLSDNPDYSPELRSGQKLAAIQFIGKVVWWGHTNIYPGTEK